MIAERTTIADGFELTNTDEINATRQRLNRLREFLLKMKMIVENDDAVATFDRAENDLRSAIATIQDRNSTFRVA